MSISSSYLSDGHNLARQFVDKLISLKTQNSKVIIPHAVFMLSWKLHDIQITAFARSLVIHLTHAKMAKLLRVTAQGYKVCITNQNNSDQADQTTFFVDENFFLQATASALPDVSNFNDQELLKFKFDGLYNKINKLKSNVDYLEEYAVLAHKFEYDEKSNSVRITTLPKPEFLMGDCLRDLGIIMNDYKLRLAALEKQVLPARRIFSTNPLYSQVYPGPHTLDERQFIESLGKTQSSCSASLALICQNYHKLSKNHDMYNKLYARAASARDRVNDIMADYHSIINEYDLLRSVCSQLPAPKATANTITGEAAVQIISLSPTKSQTAAVSTTTTHVAKSASVSTPPINSNPGSLTGVMATFGKLPVVTSTAENNTTATMKSTPGIATTATNG